VLRRTSAIQRLDLTDRLRLLVGHGPTLDLSAALGDSLTKDNGLGVLGTRLRRTLGAMKFSSSVMKTGNAGLRAWRHGARLAVFLAVLATSGSATTCAHAATRCPVGAGGGEALAKVDGEARLTWIDAHLSATAHRARVWTWGWGIGIVAATLGNLAPLPFVAKGDRIDWYVGAGTTIVGIVPLLIAPLDVVDDARRLHLRVAEESTADNVCRLLADAEQSLVRDAKNQSDGQRWWLHVGNVLLNTGVGLFLGLGYHHWGAGAWNAFGGSAIGEAIILTQPTGTMEDLRRYRTGELDAR
jgi:hypothetical protein